MSQDPVLTDYPDNIPEPREAPPHRMWAWVGALAIVAVAAPTLWLSARRSPAPPAPESGASSIPSAPRLGFSAVRENSDWRLAWNREFVASLDPIGALLSIRDGGTERMHFLAPADLASGSIIYVPRSSDIVFKFKLTSPSRGDVEEQVRVLGPEQASSTVPIYAVPSPLPAPQYEASRSVSLHKTFQPPPVVAKSAPAPPGSLVSAPEVTLPAAALPDLPHSPAPSIAPPQPAPAAVAPAQQPTIVASQSPAVAPPRTLPPVAPQAPSVEPARVPENVVSPPQQAAAPPILPKSSVKTGPAPLRMIAASWPPMVPRRGAVEVKLRVEIDASGRVVNVVPLQRTAANYQFVNSAMAAAKGWTFSPATENGSPVAGESVLTFKFTP